MLSYQEIEIAQSDLEHQNALYKPSAFWHDASYDLATVIIKHGIGNFRNIDKSLFFFVPTYGSPGGGIDKETVTNLLGIVKSTHGASTKTALSLEHFLSGRLNALADYRVLKASDNPNQKPYLHTFSESNFGNPIEHFEFEGRLFSRSSLNYLLGISLLKKHLGDDEIKTVVEIGGGFGTLGEIMYHAGISNHKYVDIDIPPINFIAQTYLQQVYGADQVTTYTLTQSKNYINIQELPAASVLCSWQIEKLQGQVDLFVNFISFQEMEPEIVQNYLYHVDRLQTKYILLRNLREGKQVKQTPSSVGVLKPIKSDNYMDMIPNYELIDRNVLPFGYQTVDNFHSEVMIFRRKP